VVVAHDGSVNKAKLQRWVSERVHKKLTFRLVNMPAIPRNDMGKVARRELADKISHLFQRDVNAMKKS